MSPELEKPRFTVADEVKFDMLAAISDLGDHSKQYRAISRNLVSDTLTAPTKEMYAYALQASLGDDVYFEPTADSLETHIARLTGKEAAVFMPSGTMSNQIALRTHLVQPPYSVLCDYRSHINKYEAGGTAFHSGAHTVAVIPSNRHHLTLPDVKQFIIQGSDIHLAPTHVIALENTLNGAIFPQEEIIKISEFARKEGIKMHLDGARLWHVATETGTSMKELCDPFDSISLCFSKGLGKCDGHVRIHRSWYYLGAPVGSCVVGTKDFIARARWYRKLFGGGMRQIGLLVGCAAYALNHNFPKLPRVHALAHKLEVGLRELGAQITSAGTCMVFFDPTPLGIEYDEISERAANLPEPVTVRGSRLVIHIQTEDQTVDDFLALVKTVAKEKKAAGFIPSPPTEGKPTTTGSIYQEIHRRQKPKSQ
ncbi:hypothetical protein BDM02DRAFT_3145765 [Thelephora ganbajun]|uniref:Uncharacterized protein n=1 Tax=Thelephora ganbajun TaxID=370292 RepID=A0ACB6ZDR6_THEGA|nr:hypothetical protein BDM02DRAFT_3145765 [Thelephora ganbajun]